MKSVQRILINEVHEKSIVNWLTLLCFIFTGVRDENDNVILVINPQNIPVKTKEEQKTMWA